MRKPAVLTRWSAKVRETRLWSAIRWVAKPVRTIHGSVRATAAAWTGLGRKRRRQATFALVVVPLLFLGTLTAASFHWTSQPSFCAKCHPMQPFIDGWEESPHRSVNCEECHLPPGTVAFVGGKIAALQVVVDYVRGDFRDESFNAVVSNAACLKCHAKVEDAVIVKDGIRVDHEGIIKLGGKCMSCHSTIGHGDATPVGARTYPTMNACFTCHNGRTASTTCTVCHVKGDWRLPPSAAATSGKGS